MRLITGSEDSVQLLFNPQSIAIVGASSKPYSISWWPAQLPRLFNYEGQLSLVNPRHSEIDGVPTFASLAEIPEVPDVAVITLDAANTLEAVRECARLGVKAAVLPTQGFGELGATGRAREEELISVARAGGVRLVGPNTDGIGNLRNGAVLSIQPLLGEGIRPGPVGVVVQSGASGGSILARLMQEGIGCSLYASAGNEVDLGLADYLSVVVQDPEIKIVLSFVESLRKPRDFERVAALAAELEKPIALIKVGRSEQGARRAAAHTGALAGEDSMYEELFRKYGVIRVDELAELTSITKFYVPYGAPRSNRVGIFSVSGGQAGAVADQVVSAGLDVPELDTQAESQLSSLLTFGSGFNPCDLTGEIAKQPSLASSVYEIFNEQQLDTVVYARKTLSGQLGLEAARPLAEAARRQAAVPLMVYAFDNLVGDAEREVYQAAGIPIFTSVHEMCKALATLSWWQQHRTRIRMPELQSGPISHTNGSGGALDADALQDLVERYNLPMPIERFVIDVESAVRAAEEIGYPVVLKVSDPRIMHKTEVGGVELNLRNADDVSASFDRIIARSRVALGDGAPRGITVHQLIPSGVEMIVGARVDPLLGPFVLLGMGGVWTEVFKDFVLRQAPVDEREVDEMLAELRSAVLLEGYRGSAAADVEALKKVVVSVSNLIVGERDSVLELDLNPVIVGTKGSGAWVADMLVIACETGYTHD